MNRLIARFYFAGLFIFLIVQPVWSQRSGSTGSGSSGSGAPGSSTSPVNPNSGGPGQQSGSNGPQFQSPLYVTGRVLMETGQPAPEPVSIGLDCGVRTLQ